MPTAHVSALCSDHLCLNGGIRDSYPVNKGITWRQMIEHISSLGRDYRIANMSYTLTPSLDDVIVENMEWFIEGLVLTP